MADADNELRRRLVVLAEESKGQAAINLIQAISCKVGERTETKVRMSASEAVGKLTGEEVEALLAEHSNC